MASRSPPRVRWPNASLRKPISNDLTDEERVEVIAATLRGLRLEVEGLRIHNASSVDFLLGAINDLTKAVYELVHKRP